MKTLRIRVEAGFPEYHGDCDWWLFDDAGRLCQQGRSEPRHWPGTAAAAGAPEMRCELLLSADQAVAFEVRLPVGSAGLRSEVLAYAVEDRLIEEPERYHLATGTRRADGSTVVVAVARERLAGVLATMVSQGLVPEYAAVEAQMLVPPEGGWALRLTPTGGVLQTGAGWLACGVGVPPPEVSWALAAQSGERCRVLHVTAAGGIVDVAAWTQALGLPVEAVGDPATEVDGIAAAVNLLQGEFLPPRRPLGLLRALRPAAWLAAWGAAAWLFAGLGEWAWLAREAAMLTARQTALFKAEFPRTTAVIPALQMQRALDEARHARGWVGTEDFLPLAEALVAAAPGRIDELRYADRRLEAHLAPPPGTSPETVRAALAGSGLHAAIAADGKGLRMVLSRRIR